MTGSECLKISSTPEDPGGATATEEAPQVAVVATDLTSGTMRRTTGLDRKLVTEKDGRHGMTRGMHSNFASRYMPLEILLLYGVLKDTCHIGVKGASHPSSLFL